MFAQVCAREWVRVDQGDPILERTNKEGLRRGRGSGGALMTFASLLPGWQHPRTWTSAVSAATPLCAHKGITSQLGTLGALQWKCRASQCHFSALEYSYKVIIALPWDDQCCEIPNTLLNKQLTSAALHSSWADSGKCCWSIIGAMCSARLQLHAAITSCFSRAPHSLI